MRELTERQEECLRLSATMTDKDIARELGLSPRTVSVHISEAMRRLEQPSRRAALRALLRENPQWGPTSIPAMAPAGLSQGVTDDRSGDLVDDLQAAPTGAFGLYSRLGAWRTPPRGTGVRAALIIGLAFVILLLVGGAVALMRVVYQVIESGQAWLN